VADLLRDYWRAGGFRLETGWIGPNKFWRAKGLVLRCSLLSTDVEGAKRLRAALVVSKNASARFHAEISGDYAFERVKADGAGSLSKKFVNVAAGQEDATALSELKAELEGQGFGRCSIVPAPFYVSARKGDRLPSLMPIASGSLFGGCKAILEEAAREANKDPSNPDPEVDEWIKESLEDPTKAKWGTHSLRRKSDKGVREYLRKRGILRESKEAVNMQFGWDQANMERDMQCRYDEADLEQRLDSADMTTEM
jgi:hypothetical protein